MHLTFLNLIVETDANDPESFINSYYLPLKLLQELQRKHLIQLGIVQRSTFNQSTVRDEISYNFIKDEYMTDLRWWQEPETTLQLLATMKPDIVHVKGLNLPLQFRWLRRIVGDNTVIVGEHTGLDYWAQRNLWLQQFGLRAVDGFIFKSPDDANVWRKNSLVLEKQPLIEITSFTSDPTKTAEKLVKFYTTLINAKNKDQSTN